MWVIWVFALLVKDLFNSIYRPMRWTENSVGFREWDLSFLTELFLHHRFSRPSQLWQLMFPERDPAVVGFLSVTAAVAGEQVYITAASLWLPHCCCAQSAQRWAREPFVAQVFGLSKTSTWVNVINVRLYMMALLTELYLFTHFLWPWPYWRSRQCQTVLTETFVFLYS